MHGTLAFLLLHEHKLTDPVISSRRRSTNQVFTVLQPIAELLALKFGGVVSIMMGAPIEADGGVTSIV